MSQFPGSQGRPAYKNYLSIKSGLCSSHVIFLSPWLFRFFSFAAQIHNILWEDYFACLFACALSEVVNVLLKISQWI